MAAHARGWRSGSRVGAVTVAALALALAPAAGHAAMQGRGALIPIGCLANADTSSPGHGGNVGPAGPAGCPAVDGLGGAFGVKVSGDGHNVYVASELSNALV